MTQVWYTSDTHFRHAKVAALRGFSSVEEHDEAVIRRWNEVVEKGDVVWHLGDFAMGGKVDGVDGLRRIAWRLNGTKHLITGNHDAPWPGHKDAWKHQWRWNDMFSSVQAFGRRQIDGRNVLLSHFPYIGDHTPEDRHTQFRLRDEGLWLLHGHTHDATRLGPYRLRTATVGSETPEWRGLQIHVGLDAWDLRPVAEQDVLALIRDHEASGTVGSGIGFG
ncbi:MAG TPA: metallophosphoesterase family protein [Streptosporangiaceae bacterium]|nr:metallophosphoesterase family protein [Streptosporangiaceae bacterium]